MEVGYLKVLIVDDDALIRDSLKILLELEEDLQVIGVAHNGEAAFRLCQEMAPDIILMDIRMPVMDGVLATKLIKESFEDIKIIMLTTFKDEEYIKEALKNGAVGYILKSQSSESIIESIRAVNSGNVVIQKEIASALTSMLKEDKQEVKTNIALTERELEVLKLLGAGYSNKEISGELFLSDGTVRNYVTTLLEKLELRDRTQLALFYVRNYE